MISINIDDENFSYYRVKVNFGFSMSKNVFNCLIKNFCYYHQFTTRDLPGAVIINVDDKNFTVLLVNEVIDMRCKQNDYEIVCHYMYEFLSFLLNSVDNGNILNYE